MSIENSVLVGRSTISTGTKGHATPSGVFTILGKKQTHYSKTYDNAPPPNMQRLTWNGIAMHSGNLPGYQRCGRKCPRPFPNRARTALISVGIAIGSASQILLFVAPVLLLAS